MSKSERKKRQRKRQAERRKEQLKSSPTQSWKQCSEYHFQKIIAGKMVNWWPSTCKCMIDNQVYRVFDENDMLAIINLPPDTQSN